MFGIVILAVVVLLYILLAFLSAKTWQTLHVVLLVGLFLASCAFSILSAATLKTQKQWRDQYRDLEASLIREQKINEELRNGSRFGQDDQPAIRELAGDVNRALVDRGRVWRNLDVAGVGDGTITLGTDNWGDEACQRVGLAVDEEGQDVEIEPIPDDAADAPPARHPMGLPVSSTVYAFKEVLLRSLAEEAQDAVLRGSRLGANDDRGVCKVPGFYMGEYEVISDPDDNGQLTLKPSLPLTESQIQQLQDGNATWVLYEQMPQDSHEALADFSEQQLRTIFPSESTRLSPDQFDELIREYARDYQRADAMDPPERKWVRVRFLKAHQLDVDMPEPISLPDQPFDPNGRSLAAILKQEEQTQFQQGDEAVLDGQTAGELIQQGICERIEDVYVRRLRDYAQYDRAWLRAMTKVERMTQLARQDLEKLNAALASLEQQSAARRDEQDKLEADKQGFERERDSVAQYAQALQRKWQETRSELSRLYRSNRTLAAQLAQVVAQP